ncbi:MAG: ankyrin repeat domain-containing protein [Methanoregula sp.]|nr:ankyrin repeat domain-containing protein [Methanoregula sp.]
MAFDRMIPRSSDLLLMEAVDTTRFESVRGLVSNGANVNFRGPHGETPLLKSLMCDDHRICKYLLESGSGVNIPTANGYSPLAFACLQNNFEYVRMLLKHKADINQKTHDGWTPLLIASTNSSVFFENQEHDFYRSLTEIMYKYAHYHPDYNPLHIINMLLNAGANPTDSNMFGMTPLMAASSMANYRIAGTILEYSKAVDLRDMEGKTALMYAVTSTIDELIESLIHLRLVGVEIKLSDFLTTDALAQIKPQFEPAKELCVNCLLECDADIHAKDKKGFSILTHAARTGNVGIVKNLVSHGADINVKSPLGITPLYAAAINGNNGIIEFLLSQGVDIDDRLQDGETPLMAAVWNGQVETVALLLRKGANVHAKKVTQYKPSGESGLVWAVHKHRKDKNENYDIIFQMLADAGAQ